MKTIATTLVGLLVLTYAPGLASAGTIFLRNNLGYTTPVVVKHSKETIYQGWLRHGEGAKVGVDVNRPKKPILSFLVYRYGNNSSTGSNRGAQPVSCPLPKKDKTLIFNLSFFASNYQQR